MRRAERLLRRADAWILAEEDPRRLAAIRVGLCGLLALRLAIADYSVVAGQPPALFQPVFYMRLFERMPSQEVATALQIGGIVAALLAAAGIRIRFTLPFAFACALVLNGMLNSAGRVIVGDALLMLCLVVLIASGAAAGEAWTLREPARRARRSLRRGSPAGSAGLHARARPDARYGWPVRTAMIAIALAYFLAGLQKWRYAGLPW